MNVSVTNAQIRQGEEGIGLLRALAYEGTRGVEVLSKILEAATQAAFDDVELYQKRNWFEIRIGHQTYRVSKDLASALPGVAVLAKHWMDDYGMDFIPLTVDTLSYWLELLKRRVSITLTDLGVTKFG